MSLKTILLAGSVIYLSLGLYLYVAQRSFIYFPVTEIVVGSSIKKYENEGQSISVSVLNEGSRKAILYFGGNAENVQFNAEDFAINFPGHAVYLVNYRGYGGSSGSPTEKGIYSDALFIHDEIAQSHDTISIIGRSLGSAVATYVASGRDIDKLALITPFDSVQRVAQSRFPIYPMKFLLKDKHDSFSRVKNIEAKTLILAAEQDNVVGFKHTERLLEGFGSNVEFHIIVGVGHNTILNSPDYYRLLSGFM